MFKSTVTTIVIVYTMSNLMSTSEQQQQQPVSYEIIDNEPSSRSHHRLEQHYNIVPLQENLKTNLQYDSDSKWKSYGDAGRLYLKDATPTDDSRPYLETGHYQKGDKSEPDGQHSSESLFNVDFDSVINHQFGRGPDRFYRGEARNFGPENRDGYGYSSGHGGGYGGQGYACYCKDNDNNNDFAIGMGLAAVAAGLVIAQVLAQLAAGRRRKRSIDDDTDAKTSLQDAWYDTLTNAFLTYSSKD
ncbi:Uncharacterised protein g670 [Pycnogonum litorale]